MNFREMLEYIRNIFSIPEFTRKRRAEESLDYCSPIKARRVQNQLRSKYGYMSNFETIDLSDDGFPTAKRIASTLRTSPSTGAVPRFQTETIVLDDDSEIISNRRGNETRFRRLTSRPFLRSAKNTSTPEDKPYQTVSSDDDDVILVKETTLGSSTGALRGTRNMKSTSLLGNSPLIVSSFYSKTPAQQNGNCGAKLKENVKPRLADRITKKVGCRPCFGSLDYSIRLDDKMQYKKLLEKAANETMNGSIYSTPVGKLFNYDTANANLSRTEKILSMATDSGANKQGTKFVSPKLSTKDTIKKVLDNFDGDAVLVKDSDSESDVIIVSPPSPKPDIVVEPVNSLQKVLDTVPETKTRWVDDMMARHKAIIEKRQQEVDELKQSSAKHEKINKDMRMEILRDRVKKSLQLKDQVLPIVEISDEIELPDLTDAQLKKVEKAFRGNPNENLVQKFSLSIARRDMLTLAGLNWLNDEVINFYMNMIIERGKNSKWPKTYAFNTFFYMKLIKNGPESIRRWTKKIDIFSHDLICVPIHLGMHWCMAIIDFRDRSIRYYDSMGSENDRCLAALKNYLEYEHEDKKKSTYDTSDFILENVKDIPQQMNGSDCGMFACTYAEFLTRNAKITFTQENMPYLRKKMVLEILEGHLLIQ